MATADLVLQKEQLTIGKGNTVQYKIDRYATNWSDLTVPFFAKLTNVTLSFEWNCTGNISDGDCDVYLNGTKVGGTYHTHGSWYPVSISNLQDYFNNVDGDVRVKDYLEIRGYSTVSRTHYVRNVKISYTYLNPNVTFNLIASPSEYGHFEGQTTYEITTRNPSYVPYKFKAVPNVGYRFVKWDRNIGSNEGVFSAEQSGNIGAGEYQYYINYTAIFETDTINKIYVGTSQPSAIYVGTQEVKAVYVGTTKVYG